jgi:hypothetical protein
MKNWQVMMKIFKKTKIKLHNIIFFHFFLSTNINNIEIINYDNKILEESGFIPLVNVPQTNKISISSQYHWNEQKETIDKTIFILQFIILNINIILDTYLFYIGLQFANIITKIGINLENNESKINNNIDFAQNLIKILYIQPEGDIYNRPVYLKFQNDLGELRAKIKTQIIFFFFIFSLFFMYQTLKTILNIRYIYNICRKGITFQNISQWSFFFESLILLSKICFYILIGNEPYLIYIIDYIKNIISDYQTVYNSLLMILESDNSEKNLNPKIKEYLLQDLIETKMKQNFFSYIKNYIIKSDIYNIFIIFFLKWSRYKIQQKSISYLNEKEINVALLQNVVLGVYLKEKSLLIDNKKMNFIKIEEKQKYIYEFEDIQKKEKERLVVYKCDREISRAQKIENFYNSKLQKELLEKENLLKKTLDIEPKKKNPKLKIFLYIMVGVLLSKFGYIIFKKILNINFYKKKEELLLYDLEPHVKIMKQEWEKKIFPYHILHPDHIKTDAISKEIEQVEKDEKKAKETKKDMKNEYPLGELRKLINPIDEKSDSIERFFKFMNILTPIKSCLDKISSGVDREQIHNRLLQFMPIENTKKFLEKYNYGDILKYAYTWPDSNLEITKFKRLWFLIRYNRYVFIILSLFLRAFTFNFSLIRIFINIYTCFHNTDLLPYINNSLYETYKEELITTFQKDTPVVTVKLNTFIVSALENNDQIKIQELVNKIKKIPSNTILHLEVAETSNWRNQIIMFFNLEKFFKLYPKVNISSALIKICAQRKTIITYKKYPFAIQSFSPIECMILFFSLFYIFLFYYLWSTRQKVYVSILLLNLLFLFWRRFCYLTKILKEIFAYPDYKNFINWKTTWIIDFTNYLYSIIKNLIIFFRLYNSMLETITINKKNLFFILKDPEKYSLTKSNYQILINMYRDLSTLNSKIGLFFYLFIFYSSSVNSFITEFLSKDEKEKLETYKYTQENLHNPKFLREKLIDFLGNFLGKNQEDQKYIKIIAIYFQFAELFQKYHLISENLEKTIINQNEQNTNIFYDLFKKIMADILIYHNTICTTISKTHDNFSSQRDHTIWPRIKERLKNDIITSYDNKFKQSQFSADYQDVIELYTTPLHNPKIIVWNPLYGNSPYKLSYNIDVNNKYQKYITPEIESFIVEKKKRFHRIHLNTPKIYFDNYFHFFKQLSERDKMNLSIEKKNLSEKEKNFPRGNKYENIIFNQNIFFEKIKSSLNIFGYYNNVYHSSYENIYNEYYKLLQKSETPLIGLSGLLENILRYFSLKILDINEKENTLSYYGRLKGIKKFYDTYSDLFSEDFLPENNNIFFLRREFYLSLYLEILDTVIRKLNNINNNNEVNEQLNNILRSPINQEERKIQQCIFADILTKIVYILNDKDVFERDQIHIAENYFLCNIQTFAPFYTERIMELMKDRFLFTEKQKSLQNSDNIIINFFKEKTEEERNTEIYLTVLYLCRLYLLFKEEYEEEKKKRNNYLDLYQTFQFEHYFNLSILSPIPLVCLTISKYYSEDTLYLYKKSHIDQLLGVKNQEELIGLYPIDVGRSEVDLTQNISPSFRIYSKFCSEIISAIKDILYYYENPLNNQVDIKKIYQIFLETYKEEEIQKVISEIKNPISKLIRR